MSASSKLSWVLTPGAESQISPFQTSSAEAWPLRILRQTPRRTAFRAESGAQDPLFVKAFLPRQGIEQRIDRWNLSRQARSEWNNLQKLSRAGIRVPQPLALAQGPEGEFWIFQEWVEGTPWNLLGRSPSRGEIRGLAQLLRSLHDCGLRDGDRHGGNFLLGPEEKSWAVDFHKAGVGPPLLAEERIEALALLQSSLIGVMAPRERARLLREYWGRAPGFREFATSVESKALRLRAESLRRKSRQSWRRGRRFESLNWENYRGFRRGEIPAEQILDACRAWKEGKTNEIKRGRRTRVCMVPSGAPLVIKAYAHRGLGPHLRAAMGWGRARRAWRRAFHLELCGDLGSRVLACLEGEEEDLLIAEMVRDGVSLSRAFGGDRAQKAKICEAIGRFVAMIHLGGLRARDLREENLILSRSDGAWKVRLIDFDGLRPCRDSEQGLRDWGRLFASFPEPMSDEKFRMLQAFARHLYGSAHPRTMQRMTRIADEAERAVKSRWLRQGKA